MKEIASKLKHGDVETFHTFFYGEKDAVYKYAFLHLRDEELALDIVQDVFLKFWQKRDDLDLQQNIKAYLYTITKHTVFEALRKKALFTQFLKYSLDEEPIVSNDNEEHQDFQELQTLYHEAILSLPDRRREIYQLSKLENFSNQEIADYLSISSNTVRDQLVKGHKFVKNYIILNSEYTIVALLFIDRNFF